MTVMKHAGLLPESRGSIIAQVAAALQGLRDPRSPAADLAVAAAKLRYLTALVDGARPIEAILAESVAFDLVFVLLRGGRLPPSLHRLAMETLGRDAVCDLMHLVGLRTLVANAATLMASRRPRATGGGDPRATMSGFAL